MALTNKLLAVQMPTLTGPGVTPSTDQGVSSLENIISEVIGVLSIVAVIWFVIQIILAGYALLSAGGDEKKIESARSRLTHGVLGLTIVVIALGLGALIASLTGLSTGGNIFDLQQLFNNLAPKK